MSRRTAGLVLVALLGGAVLSFGREPARAAPVQATGRFFNPRGSCPGPATFQDTYLFEQSGGQLTITRPATGDVARGAIDGQGNFQAVNSGKEIFQGRITGATATGTYALTVAGCTRTWDAVFTLSGPLAQSSATPQRGPDLVVMRIASAGPIRAGQPVTLLITLQNVGAAPTIGQFRVSFTLPDVLIPLDGSGPDLTCDTGVPTVICISATAPVQPQEEREIRLRLTVDPAAAGRRVQIVANVSGGGDINAGNNQSRDDVTIEAGGTPPATVTPSVTPTPTPAGTPPIAIGTGCRPATVRGTISVTVPAGTHGLEGVPVSLYGYCKTDGSIAGLSDPPLRTVAANFTMDYEGRRGGEGAYEFTNVMLPATAIPCRVQNDLAHIPGGSPDGARVFQVKHGAKGTPVVSAWKDATCAAGATTINLDWGTNGGLTPADPAYAARLDSMAYIYYYTEDIYEFFVDYLSAAPLDPLELVAWSAGGKTQSEGTNLIRIGEADSPVDRRDDEAGLSKGGPMNNEWHEFAHYVFNNVIADLERAGGDVNHDGYLNSSTQDSWDEGWAIFWPTVFKDKLGKPAPSQYADIGNVETRNIRADEGLPGPRGSFYPEDFVVAQLLWDLYDSTEDSQRLLVSKEYYEDIPDIPRVLQIRDHMQVDDKRLYNLIVANAVVNVRQFYTVMERTVPRRDSGGGRGAAHSHQIWSLVSADFSDLDEVFLMHRFYRARQVGPARNDLGWNGNPGDLGFTDGPNEPEGARRGVYAREQMPRVDGAMLRLQVRDGDGRPLSAATVVIATMFAPPDEGNNTIMRRPWTGDDLYLMPGPPDDDTLIAVWIEAEGRRSAAVTTFTSTAYWQAVATGAGGPAFNLDFTIDRESPDAASTPELPVPEDWPPPGSARQRINTAWYVATDSNGMTTGTTIIVPAGVVITGEGVIAAGVTLQRDDGTALALAEPLVVRATLP